MKEYELNKDFINKSFSDKNFVLYAAMTGCGNALIHAFLNLKRTIIITRPMVLSNYQTIPNTVILRKGTKISDVCPSKNIVTSMQNISRNNEGFSKYIEHGDFNIIMEYDKPTLKSLFLLTHKNIGKIFLNAENYWRPKSCQSMRLCLVHPNNQTSHLKTVNNNYIHDLFDNKHPYWAKYIIKSVFYSSTQYNLFNAILTLTTYIKENMQYLKHYDFSNFGNLEKIYDTLTKTVYFSKRDQVFKNVFGKKLNYLINEKNKELLNTLYNLSGENASVFKSIFANKIARFKHPSDLTFFAEKEIFNLNSSFKSSILNIVKGLSLKHSMYSNYLVVKVDNYEAMKAIGSPAWCIVSHVHYFNQYTNESDQFVLFDLSQRQSDPKSIIGFTVKNGIITYAHLKDDYPASKMYVSDIINKIPNFKEVFGYELL